jgi:hypothetical protein
VTELGRSLTTHDEPLLAIIDAIRRLMTEPETTKKKRLGLLLMENIDRDALER